MKRLLTMSLLFLTLGTFFLFAPATQKTAHADGNTSCSQNNNLTYSDGSNTSSGLLDLWPCISYDSSSAKSYGYASFRNTLYSLYQSNSDTWYQLASCSLSIGLIPVGGTFTTARDTPLETSTVDCSQWVNGQSIGVNLPTSSFSVDSLSLFGNYQTAAQVTLTYVDQNQNTLTEASPTEYSDVAQLNWSKCTQANSVTDSKGTLDLWPCMSMSGSDAILNVYATFRNDVLTSCGLSVTIDGAYQGSNCGWMGTRAGSLIYHNQFNYQSAHWSGYHTMSVQIELNYLGSHKKHVYSTVETISGYYA